MRERTDAELDRRQDEKWLELHGDLTLAEINRHKEIDGKEETDD